MEMFKNEQEYEYNVDGFFIGSNFVLYNDKLSDKAKLLYMHITNRYNFFLYANQAKARGVIDEVKQVYCESQATMAKALGYSEKSKSKVNPLIKSLEEEGLLLVIKKNDGKNSNWYVPLTKEGKPNITVPLKGVSVMYNELPVIDREERVTKKPKVDTPPKPEVVVVKEEPSLDDEFSWDDDFDPFEVSFDELNQKHPSPNNIPSLDRVMSKPTYQEEVDELDDFDPLCPF